MTLKSLLSACLLACLPLAAWSQPWPTRAVKIVVPFAPASTPDTLARLLAQKLQDRVQQPFTVENKPGAGGMLGTDLVARAAPDGQTLGVSIVGPLVNDRYLYRKMPYDPARDLAPITVAVTQPSLLVVRSDLPVRTLPELLGALKARPGAFNYASIGIGSLSHLTMASVALQSRTEIIHIPYAGSSQAVLALLSGEADMACLPALAVMPQVKGGKLRILGVSTAARSALLPEVPTLQEQGLAGIDAGAWIGVVAPAATPVALRQRIQREIVSVLQEPDVVAALRDQMMEVVAGTPEAFATFLHDEDERWRPVILRNGITLE